MLLYNYSYISDSKSNNQAFKKLLQQHIILAEPFDVSQKYCWMSVFRGIVLGRQESLAVQRLWKTPLQPGICTPGRASASEDGTVAAPVGHGSWGDRGKGLTW